MALPRIGGAGVPLPLFGTGTYGTLNGTNKITLPACSWWNIPSGQFWVLPGPYTFLQFNDPTTGVFGPPPYQSNVWQLITSDGTNWRLANMTGGCLTAAVTTAGTYTTPPTVTASAGGSTWLPILGQYVTSVTTTTAGTGYTFPPILTVAPPPFPGLPATATCVLSGSTVGSVTVTNVGAGYTSVPSITVTNDPRDTTGSGAVLTAVLGAAAGLTGLLCTNPGTAQTSVPTLSFGTGSGAATVIGCYVSTALAAGTAGVGYTASSWFQTDVVPVALTAATLTNPLYSSQYFRQRAAKWTGQATAGGAIGTAQFTAAGTTAWDQGLFGAAPQPIVTAATVAPTTVALATTTIGGISDTSYIQPC